MQRCTRPGCSSWGLQHDLALLFCQVSMQLEYDSKRLHFDSDSLALEVLNLQYFQETTLVASALEACS